MVTLFSDEDPATISLVVDELDRKGIQYELGGAGGVVRVDRRDLAKARIVAANAGVANSLPGSPSMSGSMWLDPNERKTMELRQQEKNLAASIKKYAAVHDADVHLNVPIKGPFERRVARPSASVLLELVPGQMLSEENVLAISYTVAFAVEDLQPENIRISDKAGNIYMVPDESTGNINRQIDFTTHLERKLAGNAERLLNRSFGIGNASVQVSLDMTFKQVSLETVDYDSEGRVVSQEELDTKSTTTETADAEGAAGVQSNLTTGSNGQTAVQDKSEKSNNSYLVPQTTQSESNNTPIRNAMTVSVLINQAAPGVSQEDGTLTADIRTRVEQLVKMAVGFREDSDQIFVDFATFPQATEGENLAAPIDWAPIQDLVRNLSLAVAALVALAIGFLTLRHFKSSTLHPQVDLAANPSATSLNQLSELARSNPEVFARIFRTWAGGDLGSNINSNGSQVDQKAA
jgi:flagellar M-ring protein FliF